MVIFQILLLSDKRVISKERNTVRASNQRAILTWTDNTSKVGYVLSKSCNNVNVSSSTQQPLRIADTTSQCANVFIYRNTPCNKLTQSFNLL